MTKKTKIFILMALFVVGLTILAIVKKGENAVLTRDYDDIRNDSVLHVVMEYMSDSYVRVDDTIVGEQYELVQSLSDYLKIPVEIHLENDLTKSIDGLNEGKYDLIARRIPVTTELREDIAFTDNLSLDKQVLVQRIRRDTTSKFISSQLELPDKKIFVVKSSPVLQRLKNLETEIGDTLCIEQMSDYNAEQLVMLVSSGDIDYAVCDYGTASRLTKQYKNIDISTNISFSQLQAWAVRQDAVVLLDTINAWIHYIQKHPIRKTKKRS
jgi:membrane-bound lytic murein transglycosylase MltF